jgi:uncharacterized cupredoxin-like copper-binding protein
MRRSLSRSLFVVPIAASMLLVGSACSSDDDEGSSGGGSITATEKDFEIALDATTVDAGSVKFTIHNDGPSTHEFVVFKSELAPDQLPTASNGTVDEEGEGVESVDEVEDLESGSDATLTVDLDPGSYVVICNLPGHYGQGMRTALTVS